MNFRSEGQKTENEEILGYVRGARNESAALDYQNCCSMEHCTAMIWFAASSFQASEELDHRVVFKLLATTGPWQIPSDSGDAANLSYVLDIHKFQGPP